MVLEFGGFRKVLSQNHEGGLGLNMQLPLTWVRVPDIIQMKLAKHLLQLLYSETPLQWRTWPMGHSAPMVRNLIRPLLTSAKRSRTYCIQRMEMRQASNTLKGKTHIRPSNKSSNLDFALSHTRPQTVSIWQESFKSKTLILPRVITCSQTWSIWRESFTSKTLIPRQELYMFSNLKYLTSRLSPKRWFWVKNHTSIHSALPTELSSPTLYQLSYLALRSTKKNEKNLKNK